MHLIIEIFFGIADVILAAVFIRELLTPVAEIDEMEFMPNDPLW